MIAKTVLKSTLAAAVTVLMAVTLFPMLSRAETIIKVGGTGSALGTMRQLAAAYEKTHPGIRIKVMPSLGSTAGIKATLAGALDFGLASRPLKDNERQQGAHSVEYARTPFVFITNPTVIKKNLTTRELEEIYNRPDARWPDGKPIRLILRPEQDTDTLLVSSASPAMPLAVKAAHGRPGMTIAITDQEAAESVSRISSSFGTAALSEILSEKIQVNVLSLNGVPPTAKGLADKSYPLFKSFSVVTSPKTSAEARKFAAFITSPAASSILQANGNLPVKAK